MMYSKRATSIETPGDLLAAARAEGVRLTTAQADFDRSGLDFLVVHAHDEGGVPWVVRTPRRPDVLESARTEARVLAFVGPRLPVRVPEWRVFTPSVIAYPRLDGTPAVTVDPSSGPRWNILDPAAPSEAFLASFADALSALLSIPRELAEEAGIPSTTIPEVRASLRKTMDDTRDALAPTEAVLRRWHRWLDDDDAWPRHTALAHGDLHPGHLLLDDGGRLTGILDWTEAKVTDPSLDLAMFHGCFGRAALEAVVARLERAGVRTWPRLVHHAAERWAAFPVLGAEWALRTGNDAVLDQARGFLAQVAAETEG